MSGSRTWTPEAFWLTVDKDGLPKVHATRFAALFEARSLGYPAYRQDAKDGRLDLIYYPAMKAEYKPRERTLRR